MKNVICVIIEDEPLGAKSLESLLKNNHPSYVVKRVAKTLQEAKDALADDSVSLYFTDIELVDGNVFEILPKDDFIKGKYFIFTTAYEEFGAKAFQFPALHYLMKPISPEELKKAIKRYEEVAFNRVNWNEKEERIDGIEQLSRNKLVLPTQNGTSFIDISSIVRIQSSNKYSILFTTDRRQHIVVKPLSRFEDVLAEKGFIRTHDSHLINVRHVVHYIKGKGGEIVMSDNSKVPVATRRKEMVSAIFKNVI
jgi:two-component system LytT family response regulator